VGSGQFEGAKTRRMRKAKKKTSPPKMDKKMNVMIVSDDNRQHDFAIERRFKIVASSQRPIRDPCGARMFMEHGRTLGSILIYQEWQCLTPVLAAGLERRSPQGRRAAYTY